ncbi:hypothetical protein PsorP6_015769 [Peronosclerospora sorghi]|uniref:Uncharacterized protein n=1 Tax=Peronosclerospora sorghi TaxID=230839 RepID=A0ACC0WRV3_9STRA|nr:hypothetical protein PsorP6_015769 [Peronosclerospora sorghi]
MVSKSLMFGLHIFYDEWLIQKFGERSGLNLIAAGMAGTSEAILAPFEPLGGRVSCLYLPLSRTRSSGEIVVRFEADVTASTVDLFSNGLERITRPFIYIGVPTEAQGDESVEGHPGRTVRLTRAPRERRETKADAPNERSQAIWHRVRTGVAKICLDEVVPSTETGGALEVEDFANDLEHSARILYIRRVPCSCPVGTLSETIKKAVRFCLLPYARDASPRVLYRAQTLLKTPKFNKKNLRRV